MKHRSVACRVGLVLALLVYAPAVWACPVCFSAKNEENRIAFIITTAFLTFLPLGLFGGGVWWLHRRARQADDRAQRLPKQRRSSRATEQPGPILPGFEDIPPAG